MHSASSPLRFLRQAIDRIGRDGGVRRTGRASGRVATGHGAIDTVLGGGLKRGAIHEVMPAATRDLTAATGFALGLIARMAEGRDWLWIGEDKARLEAGQAYGPGLKQFGLDPARLILVAPRTAEDGLKASEDALRCAALGAVLFEPWGDPKRFDLVALRRLALAAEESDVPLLLLRSGGRGSIGATHTRWHISTAPSGAETAPGHPRFAVALLLNRQTGAGGPGGSWITEWCHGERLFRPANPVDLFSASFDGPAETPDPHRLRASSA